jgi:hypothetical protein
LFTNSTTPHSIDPHRVVSIAATLIFSTVYRTLSSLISLLFYASRIWSIPHFSDFSAVGPSTLIIFPNYRLLALLGEVIFEESQLCVLDLLTDLEIPFKNGCRMGMKSS